MKIAEIAVNKTITVGEDDTISKALTKMEEHRIHQLPVLKEDSVVGIILLKHLLGREYNPSKTPVKNFTIKVPYLHLDMDLDDAIVQIIKSGVRALPIVENDELVGILSETDLIKNVEFVRDIRPEKLMSSAITIANDGNLDKAMSLMYENSISRLPVKNFDEKLVGCLDSLSLIRFLIEPKESPRYSELTGIEKESLKNFKVKDYTRDAFPLSLNEFSLKKVIKILQDHEEVIITKDQIPIGVIVPKDVLELAQLVQPYPVHVSHLHGIDTLEVSKFQDILIRFMGKFEKIFNIQNFFIYADTHKKKEEGHKKFSLRAKLITDKKFYVAKSNGWNLKEATHTLLDNLEKQLVKNHEKHLGKAKRRIKD